MRSTEYYFDKFQRRPLDDRKRHKNKERTAWPVKKWDERGLKANYIKSDLYN